jgi:transposase InsO family protein
VVEPQTLKGITGRHLNLRVNWQDQQFEALVDSGATRNHISPAAVTRMGLPHRQKRHPYPLTTISGDQIAYGGGIINLETGPIQLTIEGRPVEMSFDILPLGKDEAILGMPWLQEYNPKIDWVTGQVDIKDTRRRKMRQQTKLVWYQVGATYEETKQGLSHVPKRYHKYGKKLWSPESEKLSEHAAWDHEIGLEPGTSPRFFPTYKLTETESVALKEFVQENLRKGYIRPSQSSAGYPVLFIPKKNGKLRMCIDYRQLNSITRKDRYPLPLISEIQDRIGNAQIFTKIDLRWAYHQIRIKEGDEWKAAFRSKEGLYEPLVMQFGLTNAPATFQKRINSVLGEHLDEFVMAYLDDIIIYSMSEEEHGKHVEWVLRRLQEEKMPVAVEKCEFFTRKTDFVGFIIEPGKISMDPKKVEAIVSWQEPENVTQLRSFLGFCNYYRRFIAQWSKNVEPFTRLTKKEEPWIWGNEQKKLFQELKELFTQDPILKIYQPKLDTVVETDASDFALGACLLQRHPDGWHPVAYYSRKMTPPELNYDIYNKELLGIVAALKEWRAFLQGTEKPFVVKTDHKNLTGFLTTKELNRRQVRWAEMLAEYHFEIQHTKGTDNARADALSRKAELQNDEKPSGAMLRKDKDGLIRYNHPKIAATREVSQIHESPESDWTQKIQEAQSEDPDSEQYEHREATYVPKAIAEEFVKEFHKGMTQGHNGATGLVSRLQEEYIIQGIWGLARQVTKECPDCQRNKPTRHKPYGGLQPVEIPERPWEVISWDFVVKLPKSRDPITGQDHDAILVIVDKLTKWGYFIACTEEISAEDVARIYVKEVFARHGAPTKIISDRDPRFVAAFWEVFLAEQGVRAATSTAYHPQTDGQTERLNQTLEQYLRHYVNHAQNNWVSLLPVAQFAYNATPQEGMGTSPFKANYGYEPRTSLSPRQAKKTSSTAKERMETLMNLHDHLKSTAKLVQERMKRYYNARRSEGPDLKEGDKVWLLHKNFKSRRPSKKLDHVRLGPFTVKTKISEVTYRLDLPEKMKIYPVQHIAMLEPAYGNVETPVYEADTYRGQEEDEWEVSKIVSHEDIDNETWYEVKWTGYEETTWEPLDNLKNATRKVEEYRRKLGQAASTKKDRQRTSHLRGTQEEEHLPTYSELFLPRLEENPFFHRQVPANLVPQVSTPWNAPFHALSQDGLTEQKQPDESQEPVVEQRQPLAQRHENDEARPVLLRAHHQAAQQQIERETLRQVTQGTRRLLRVIGRAHSASETKRTSQDDRTFALVHSEHEEGCRDEGLANATQTNPSFAQREQGDGIVSPRDSITATVRDRRTVEEEAEALGIMSKDVNQIDQTDITPLVDDLEMLGIFEDEDEEEGDGVTNALSTMLRLLGEESEEASWLIRARSRMEPVEPCDEEW